MHRYDNTFLNDNINSIEPFRTDECIQWYFSLSSSDRNPNITDRDNNISQRTLDRTQSNKTVKCKTFVDYGHQVKHKTQIEINSFHKNVVSI